MKFFLPYPERAALALLATAPDNAEVIAPSQVLARIEMSHLRTITLPTHPHLIRRMMERSLPHRFSLRGMNVAKQLWARKAASHIGPTDSVFAFPGAALELFRRTKGTKVFHAVDAHPIAHNASLRAASADPAEFYSRGWVKRIMEELRIADIVLAPSHRTANQMIENGVAEARVRVVPYGVDTKLFRPQISPLTSETPIVIYVGQFSTRKGVAALVEAASSSEVELWLVGNAFTPEFRSITSIPGLRVIQPQAHSELVKLYNAADAFVIATAEDACSLVALEAAATGLPVLSTINNGAAEILPPHPELSLGKGTVSEIHNRLTAITKLTNEKRVENSRSARQSGVHDWSEYSRKVLAELKNA